MQGPESNRGSSTCSLQSGSLLQMQCTFAMLSGFSSEEFCNSGNDSIVVAFNYFSRLSLPMTMSLPPRRSCLAKAPPLRGSCSPLTPTSRQAQPLRKCALLVPLLTANPQVEPIGTSKSGLVDLLPRSSSPSPTTPHLPNILVAGDETTLRVALPSSLPPRRRDTRRQLIFET
jgi:hypothetical protein